MAPPVGTLRVGRYFLALLAIIAVLYMIVFWPGQRHTPKLGLDLVGGTQVIFTAKTDNGGTPSSDSMEQARQIMEERVNGTGVTEATVIIQGSSQLVVSIPGKDPTSIQDLGAAALLNFRGLVAPATPVSCAVASAPTPGSSGSSTAPSTSPSTSPSASQSGAAAAERPLAAASSSSGSASGSATTGAASSSGSTTPAGTSATTTPTPTASTTAPATVPCSANSVATAAKAGNFTVPLDDTAYAKLTSTQQTQLKAGLAGFDCASGQTEKDIPGSYFVACDDQGLAYLLGPVIVAGKEIDTASAVAPNASSGNLGWTVALELKDCGGDCGQGAWAKYTSKHNINGQDSSTASGPTACGGTGTPCADYVAFTLDGKVITSPVNESTINGGTTQISGSFNPDSARDLANKLKYGALPLSFKTEQAQEVSATLGSSQLKAGLLAGGIGLVLVVIYSLIYYRALGLVTIASLLVSGALTYGCLVMLGTQIGFTLSLAGIAGFIVAVGITADSFVVFFERLKDEVHEGRSVRVAVPRAWVRARRTILSADTVSFLAAAILYYFAAGDVKGFAFTLGLSTILDLVVVFLFTHPMVSLLSRSQTFGSSRMTGLDALRSGPAVSDTAAPATRRTSTGTAARVEAAERPASVAVLDREDQPAPEEPADDEPVVEDEADAGDRRRTTPETGSAAERAAARRARLREDREKGNS